MSVETRAGVSRLVRIIKKSLERGAFSRGVPQLGFENVPPQRLDERPSRVRKLLCTMGGGLGSGRRPLLTVATRVHARGMWKLDWRGAGRRVAMLLLLSTDGTYTAGKPPAAQAIKPAHLIDPTRIHAPTRKAYSLVT